MMKKWLIFLIICIVFFLPFILAEQVIWNNDTDINITDTWQNIDGTPLTGASCSWIVYFPNMSINQSGIASEFAVGSINFTVNQLPIIGIYPMLINCSLGGFNGTSSLREIKIVDELTEDFIDQINLINQTISEINITVAEINITTHNIYDYLTDTINVTLNNILNFTNMTYEEVVDLDTNLTSLISTINSLKTYVEAKWGNENADEIMEKLKDINRGVSYLESEFYYLSQSARNEVLLSIKKDTRDVLAMVYTSEEGFNKIYLWIIPGIVILFFIILIIYFVKRKKPEAGFGGEMDG